MRTEEKGHSLQEGKSGIWQEMKRRYQRVEKDEMLKTEAVRKC